MLCVRFHCPVQCFSACSFESHLYSLPVLITCIHHRTSPLLLLLLLPLLHRVVCSCRVMCYSVCYLLLFITIIMYYLYLASRSLV